MYSWKKKTTAIKKADTVFALILLMAVIMSTVFSSDSRNSFFKMEQRTVSGLCFLCCIMVYFFVREYGKYDGLVLWGWLAGSAVIYLFGILCACGINFMHIQDGITLESAVIFLTPLGNAGINASYVCLMLPPIIVMYMTCKELFSQTIHGLNIYMGFLFVFFIKTDSSIIAIGAGLVMLIFFAVEEKGWFERYIQITGIYAGSRITLYILERLFGGRLHPFDGIGKLLLSGRWMICEISCLLLLCAMWIWKKDGLRKKLLAIRKYVLGAGVITVLCCVVCTAYVNLKSADIPDESILRHLLLKDSTFHRRGLIWKRTIKMMGKAGVIHKIFGNGLNSFAEFMSGESISPVTGKTYYDPHNEILQIFSDMGFMGLMGYFGLIISSMIKALRKWKDNELQIAVAMTIGVYLIQSLVNGFSIFCLPLLFIFLGLANGSMGSCQKGNL